MGCCATHIVGTGSGGGGGGAAAALEAFQVDSLATITMDSTTLTTLDTLAGDAKVLSGSTWKINYGLQCAPTHDHLTNAETVWSIETSTGVFAIFNRWTIHYGITLAGDEKAIPMHLQQLLVPTMNSPRMLCEVHKITTAGAAYYWEEPRWGGVLITEAP